MANRGGETAACSVPESGGYDSGTPVDPIRAGRGLTSPRQANRVAQQITIAAAHIVETIGDQTPNLVLAGIGFPIGLTPVEAEKRFGNLAIAGAIELSVQCSQCEDVPATGLWRKVVAPVAGRSVPERAPKAQQRCNA